MARPPTSPTGIRRNIVIPISLSTGTPGTPIRTGKTGANGIAITPDGSTAYVTDGNDGTVTPITLATATAGTPINAGETGVKKIAITPDGQPPA